MQVSLPEDEQRDIAMSLEPTALRRW